MEAVVKLRGERLSYQGLWKLPLEFIDFKRDNTTITLCMNEIVSNIYVFVCQKCGHCWLPRSRDYNDMPQHCPNCHDNYWFISHEKLKEIKQKNANNTFKTDAVISKEKSLEKERNLEKEKPKEKQKIRWGKEKKVDW